MDNSYTEGSYELPILVLVILCLVVSVVIWMKMRSHCSQESKQKYTRVKASPPSPGSPATWVNGSVKDCQDAFDSEGCGDDVSCCDCGDEEDGPKYYCDGLFTTSHQLGFDPSCSVGTPFAMNRKMCESPVKAGPLYCGGALEDDCQDVGQECIEKPGMPFGAKGMCGVKQQ